jgi:hypothetical protein
MKTFTEVGVESGGRGGGSHADDVFFEGQKSVVL